MKLLDKKGKGARTYYQPTDIALATWRSKQPESPLKSREFDPKSREFDLKSRELDPKSKKHNPTPLEPEIPEALKQKIAKLGGKSTDKKLVTDVVYELLVWRELTVAQLADYINRTPDHIRRTYLKDMITADLIRPMSKSPNDPNQTYRAVKAIKQRHE